MPSPVIFGFQGLTLTDAERDFFKQINPYGIILFARNIDTPEQVKALTASLREISGNDDLPILIDQEGGRVARLKPPHFRACPSAAQLLESGQNEVGCKQLIYDNAVELARELVELGITVDCAPVADIPIEGADPIISDRAYGTEPGAVAMYAAQMARGLIDGGVQPVLKHIPGHGRALVDSHLDLPVVDTDLETLRAVDFAPFKALNHLPYAMTAHIVFTAIDADEPVTFSKKCIDLIRDEIGFNNLIMSDDLSMKALSGDFTSRAQKALNAGCDLLLHCNGDMDEMQAIAKAL